MSGFPATVPMPCAGCDAELMFAVVVHPGRPAPPCSNPNSPAYSDSGDPGWVDIEDGPTQCPSCGWIVTREAEDSLRKSAMSCDPPEPDYPDYDDA